MTTDIETACNALLHTLSAQQGYTRDDFWLMYYPVEANCAWKLHLYADTAQDWLAVAQVLLPYLQEHHIAHKTIASLNALEALNQNGMQLGKAFTIYGTSVEALQRLIPNLDQLLVDNRLNRTDDPIIYGDRRIGQSRRIFYRYEKNSHGNYRLNDGQYKPETLPDPFQSLETPK